MRFNCTRMEVLTSGESCANSSTFEVHALTQGSFSGRIKRTGFRTKALGCLDLILVEAAPNTAEQLAICYADENPSSEMGRSLVFPLIQGREFGNVSRHGNVLTVQASRLALTLESIMDDDVESDRNVSSTAGKWSRIFSRLVCSRDKSIAGSSAPGLISSNSNTGFEGLGINVNPSRISTIQYSASQMKPAPNSTSNSSISRSRQLVPTTMQPSSAASTLTSPAAIPAQGMSNSKSLKRISLLLSDGNADFGFGDDLKTILSKMDEPEPEQEIDVDIQPAAPELSMPNAPFNTEETESDFSVTPSPNSLYLDADDVTPNSSFNSPDTTKRVDSILAKEQRQYAEKYGVRASTLSDFYTTQSSSSTEPPVAKASARVPPQMPAPVLQNKPVSENRIDEVDEDDFEFSKEFTAGTKLPKFEVTKPQEEPVSERKESASEAKALDSKKKAKSVSISQDISVINGAREKKAAKPQKADSVSTVNNVKSPKFSSTKSASPIQPSDASPKSTGPKFTKVMKKLLGKRKSRANLSVPSGTENNKQVNSESKQQSPVASPSSPNQDQERVEKSFEVAPMKEKSSPMPPTPESINDDGKPHLYANLLQDSELPSLAVTPQEDENEKPESGNLDSDVVAKTTNNGGQTAAKPRLRNSTSALSFRSLSSRSTSARSLATRSDTHNNTTPEKEQVKASTPISESAEQQREQQSPTLLRRESRESITPEPIKLNLDEILDSTPAAKKMYESGNKSMSALEPAHSSSCSSFNSSKKSLSSYTSASSISSGNNTRKDAVTMFSADMWASVWNVSKWVPLSQLEMSTEIISCDSSSAARILVNGGASVNVKFSAQCEIRRVSQHDVELKSTDATYMFRGRDPENAQRFFRLLWSIQTNGVQPVLSALMMAGVIPSGSSGLFDEQDTWADRRKTLMPPALSKSNPNLNLSYMGRPLTSTIIEE